MALSFVAATFYSSIAIPMYWKGVKLLIGIDGLADLQDYTLKQMIKRFKLPKDGEEKS